MPYIRFDSWKFKIHDTPSISVAKKLEFNQKMIEFYDTGYATEMMEFLNSCLTSRSSDFYEIQAAPRALTALKYFCEDMTQLALCSAGSLLGVILSEESFPMGKVSFLHLYPLNFSEFLEAVDELKSVKWLPHLH